MAKKLRVGVVYGGRSAEHDISVMSAKYIMELLNPQVYEIVPIGITREGQWLMAEDVKRAILELKKNRRASFEDVTAELPTVSPQTLVMLKQHVDVIFPVLHGRNGEDGVIQGFLEQVDVPYVGCNVLASALAMDKAITKAILKANRVPVGDWVLVSRADWEASPEEVIGHIESRMHYPCFVKPANSGSSIGVSKASCQDELRVALTLAATYDRRMLVEEMLEGREIEVGILGNEDPVVSVPGEVVSSRSFYDYEAKYTDGGAALHIPAELPERVAEKIQALAVEAYEALDCSGLARVDFFVTRGNKVYVNEVNTMPGFTAHSIYPELWAASGITGEDLVARLIALAMERYKDKQYS
jgi:D-alanine-D-alanine ligase